MSASAPRIGFAVLALAAAAAITLGVALPLLSEHPVPAVKTARTAVSIEEVARDEDARDQSLRVQPASAGTIDTVTVRASR